MLPFIQSIGAHPVQFLLLEALIIWVAKFKFIAFPELIFSQSLAHESPGSAPISSLKWCGNCNYLAAVDYNAKLYVYTFDGHDLTLSTSISLLTTQTYNSVDVCDDCSYIVAGGQDINGHAVFDIYQFDPRSTESLTTVTSRVISSDSSYVDSVKWCQGCDNLAVGGEDDNTGLGILQLYHFDSQSKILSQPLTATTLNYFANSVNWCGNNCCYLAVGGTQKPDPAFHNIYSYDIECCFDSHTNRVYTTWYDSSYNFQSAYLDDSGTTWILNTAPTTSAFLHIKSHNIECCFDNHLNRIYATWYDSSHNFQSAYLDDSGTTWILNTAPTTSAFLHIGSYNIECCFDSYLNRIYATWYDSSGNFQSAYLDDSGTTWIPNTASGFFIGSADIECCFDSKLNRIYATWYDGSRSFQSAYLDDSDSGTWTLNTPPGWDNIVGYDINCCFDSHLNRIYATWFDGLSEFQSAYLDDSGSGTWTLNKAPGFADFASYDIECCFDSHNNRIYATWYNGFT